MDSVLYFYTERWEEKTSVSSSSLIPVIIRSFNGKRQLEELVKIIPHLPAFLCVCVCLRAVVHSFMPVFISTTHGQNVYPFKEKKQRQVHFTIMSTTIQSSSMKSMLRLVQAAQIYFFSSSFCVQSLFVEAHRIHSSGNRIRVAYETHTIEIVIFQCTHI